MKLDASLLTRGYTTTDRDGLYAEFYEDGQIARFGCTIRAGDTLTLYLERGGGGGRFERVNVFSREVAAAEDIAGDIFEYEHERDYFGGWVQGHIQSIYDATRSGFRCNFCGKGQEEVAKLIAGPGVYICNECIALCNEILAEEGSV